LITIVAFQVPNCKMKFADDPEKKHRSEDSQLAWSLHMFLDSLDPNDMLIYPMAKASLAIAKAAIDYEVKKGNLDEGAGTVFQGASKRGWAMWMVGASVGAKTDYPPVLGILPMVPIVPDLVKNLHR
jgi:PhoPQ-activated pathogenicity-related protein